MEKVIKNKMTADVYFEHNGEFIPAMCRRIQFVSERGLKTAFINVCRKSMTSLHLQYGSFQRIYAKAYMNGKEIASTNFLTY